MNDQALKSYLFVIDSSTMSRDDAIERIDNLREVENWHKMLPDAAILVSRLNINSLNSAIKSNLEGQRYILTKLESGNKNGWLARSSWDFMNNPKSVFE